MERRRCAAQLRAARRARYSDGREERQREADVEQHFAERARPVMAKNNEPITGATASRPGQLMRSSTPREST